ncbi:hypothetical protein Glove_349g78 [Diversispora epigaea]|uniref:Uncharacterized protein n=1 Tax=Diversispora epigaea TaxID=1348612 RepID=A0A397HEE0_9GLOM|nr:hypothetical protein Glove_349g78 [Diversispora epigaea]
MAHNIQIMHVDPLGNELDEFESLDLTFLSASSTQLEFSPWIPSQKLKKLYN